MLAKVNEWDQNVQGCRTTRILKHFWDAYHLGVPVQTINWKAGGINWMMVFLYVTVTFKYLERENDTLCKKRKLYGKFHPGMSSGGGKWFIMSATLWSGHIGHRRRKTRLGIVPEAEPVYSKTGTSWEMRRDEIWGHSSARRVMLSTYLKGNSVVQLQ